MSSRGTMTVVMTKGNLDAVPSLRDMIGLLVDRGWRVTIIAPFDPSFSPIAYRNAGVCVQRLPGVEGRWGSLGKVATFFCRLAALVLSRHSDEVVCGVDPGGLILSFLVRCCKTRVYVSLEIYCQERSSGGLRRFEKWIERRLHQRTAYTIIQDSGRADLLQRENRFPSMRTLLLPNGSRSGLQSDVAPGSREAIRARYGIRDHEVFVLHCGSLERWTCCEEIVQAARYWEPHWVLVFQCRKRPKAAFVAAVNGMRDAVGIGAKVVILEEPLPSRDLASLVAAADVGLALYQPEEGDPLLGQNLTLVGRSSGKIAEYLKHGLPVVASALPSIRAFLDGSGAGVCVANSEEIRGAISSILPRRGDFSVAARRCYNDVFAIEPFVQAMDATLRDE